MGTLAIKELLHGYIDTGDDKLLQMIYAMVREYNNPALTESDITELEKRTEKRNSGQSNLHDWPATKNKIIGKDSK